MNAITRHFGHDAIGLDRLASDAAQRIVLIGKARQYRQDYFSLAKAVRILGSWEAHGTGAGGWGDLYVDMSIPEARDFARRCWREELAELAAMREG